MPTAKPLQSILYALLLGALLGIVLNQQLESPYTLAFLNGLLVPLGTAFIKLLKLVMIPMVAFSLVAGITRLHDAKEVGTMGLWTIGIYMLTTSIAIGIAIVVAELFQFTPLVNQSSEAVALTIKDAPSLKSIFLDLFATNPFQALVDGKMLQIIVISIITGLAIHQSKDAGKPLQAFIDSAFAVTMKIVDGIIWIAPVGIFCLIAKVFALNGLDTVMQLLGFVSAVILALLLHAILIYGSLLKWVAKVPVVHFIKKIKTVLIFAFSTSSSSATLPLTIKTLEDELGVKNKIAAFTAPLGATINMDGTAIMQGVATVFLAAAYGISLTFNDYILVMITATLASIGTAGVPGAGMIMLAMVLKQVGLPVEGIALIIGVDRLIDMARTAVNVLGDSVVTMVVAKQFDKPDTTIKHG